LRHPERARIGRAAAPGVLPESVSKPIRTVLKWQVLVTALMAAVAGAWLGFDGALSAALGGAVNVVAGGVYWLLLGLSDGKPRGADRALMTMLRAEGGKVLAIIGALWIVLSTYKDVVMTAFFATFVVTVIVFSMAFFVRD
jgi:ATP synthase protein I